MTNSNNANSDANGYWGSPGAGSSGSPRDDSPIPLNLGSMGQVAVGVGGANGEDAELGGVVADGIHGLDGETVNGKRKR